MRIAYIGVGHWHTKLYLDPVLDLTDADLVGVSDPDPAAADVVAGRAGTRAYTDFRTMCEQARPDMVFALGRHIDMAAEAEYLIESGIPFGMEKPCGISVEQIAHLAELAREKDAFAAIPLTFRTSEFVRLIREHSPGKELTYGLFRMIPGGVSRYRDWGVDWNLDHRIAGGGCTLNLGIHFFDLATVLAPSEPWAVSSASMSSLLTGVDVEDFSLVTMESGGRRVSIETGYAFPDGPAFGESHYSVCMEGDWFRWDGGQRKIIVTPLDGPELEFPAPRTQTAYYPHFVRDAIRRVQEGERPVAGLPEVLAAATLVDSAYRLAGREGYMSAGHGVPGDPGPTR